MGGNASGSTLRLSIGCLLSDTLGIQLRRVGRTARLTFSRSEAVLSEWLEENAFVTWVAHDEPWVVEPVALSELYLPLNLDMNKEHPFRQELAEARKAARVNARRLSVLAK